MFRVRSIELLTAHLGGPPRDMDVSIAALDFSPGDSPLPPLAKYFSRSLDSVPMRLEYFSSETQ